MVGWRRSRNQIGGRDRVRQRNRSGYRRSGRSGLMRGKSGTGGNDERRDHHDLHLRSRRADAGQGLSGCGPRGPAPARHRLDADQQLHHRARADRTEPLGLVRRSGAAARPGDGDAGRHGAGACGRAFPNRRHLSPRRHALGGLPAGLPEAGAVGARGAPRARGPGGLRARVRLRGRRGAAERQLRARRLPPAGPVRRDLSRGVARGWNRRSTLSCRSTGRNSTR